MSDKPPDWAAGIFVRRILWEHYGIPATDISIEEIFSALALEAAITERQNQNGG